MTPELNQTEYDFGQRYFYDIARLEQYPTRAEQIVQSAEWVGANCWASRLSTSELNAITIVTLNQSLDLVVLPTAESVKLSNPHLEDDSASLIAVSVSAALTDSPGQTNLSDLVRSVLSITRLSPLHLQKEPNLITLMAENAFWQSIRKSMLEEGYTQEQAEKEIRRQAVCDGVRLRGFPEATEHLINITKYIWDNSEEIAEHITGVHRQINTKATKENRSWLDRI